MRYITVTKAIRISVQSSDNKDSDRRSRPGVIVASLQSKDNKRKVMENKRKLNRHKGVSFHGDQSKEERLQRANMKTLIDCIKQGHSDPLQLKGSGNRNQNRKREQEQERRERALRDRSDSGQTSESREHNRGAPRRDFQRDDTRNGRIMMRRNNNSGRKRK